MFSNLVPFLFDPIEEINIRNTYIYYDEPILFSFYNKIGNLFLANVIEFGDDFQKWVYIPVSIKEVINIEKGESSLLQGMMDSASKYCYLYDEYYDGTEGQYYLIDKKMLPTQVLPDEDFYIYLNSNQLDTDSEIIENVATNQNRNVIDIDFAEKGNHDNHEVSAQFLGQTLISLQDYINYNTLKADADSKARVSDIVKEANQIVVTRTYAASFGIRIESKYLSDMLGISNMDDSLNKLINIFDLALNNDSEEILLDIFDSMNQKSINKIKELVHHFKGNKMEGNIAYARPISESIEKKVTSFNLESLSNIINKLNSKETTNEIIPVNGTLKKIDKSNNTFKLVNTEVIYKGYIDKSLENYIFEVESDGTASIEKIVEKNTVAKTTYETYVLRDWTGI